LGKLATNPLLLGKQPKETEFDNSISIILTNLDFTSGCAVTLSGLFGFGKDFLQAYY